MVGSVARGTERATSDVDVYLVVTDDAFAAAQSARRVAYIDTEAATYDSYVDIKLASPRYLERAVAHATIRPGPRFRCPDRFRPHQVDGAAVARIVALPDDFWQRRVHAYRCQARLYGGYFLKQATSGATVPAPAPICRLAVGRWRWRSTISVPGAKYLAATLSELRPAGWLPLAWHSVLADPTPDRRVRHDADMVDTWQRRPARLGRRLVDLHHRQQDAFTTFNLAA